VLSQSSDALRTALAMGCDRALLVETSPPLRGDIDLPHVEVASILSHLVRAEKVDLLLTGKQAIDDDSGLVPAMTAALMGAAQATCAAKVERGEGGRGLRVTREVDGGSQVVELPLLPAVVSVDLRLNVPRYATLPNIMKAKKKPLEVRPLSKVREEAGVRERERVRVREVREPKERRAGVKVDTVEALVRSLREEAKVI
jgi:electron transfer flavoprotein beta subunit